MVTAVPVDEREIASDFNPGSRDWVQHARCVGIPTDVFYANSDDIDIPLQRAVKRLCDSCPVQLDCLAYGMWETGGIWGGATDQERRLIAALPRNLAVARNHSRWLREFLDRYGSKINGCLQNLPTGCLQGDLAVSNVVSKL